MSPEQQIRTDGRNRTLPAHERARDGDRSAQGFPIRGSIEAHLKNSVELEILEHSPCGQALLALDGIILFANPAFRKLCGLDAAGAISEHHFQQSLTKGAAIFYENQFLPTLLQRGEITGIALELSQPSGEQVQVFVSAVLRRCGDGNPNGVFLAVFDATQRRLYEKELLRARKEAELLSEVVRRSSDAILRLSPDGIIQSWNEGARHMFGWSSDEALGQSLAFLLEDQGKSQIQDAMPLLGSGLQAIKESAGLRKDGSGLEVSISLTPHLEAPGILVAFSAIIRDVTSQKVSERVLLQNEKLASVGRLASSIAHEINNPLESVTNLLYILQSRSLDPETLAFVLTAQEELARVSQIATQTLRFYKQSSSRTHLHLAALAESVLALYRARFANAGVSATNESKRASPLFCFEGELRQIMVNLVSNAYDAMKSGGKLTIRSRDTTILPECDCGVRITVADTGLGMDPMTLRRVFEPFFTTKGLGGTGLGLWITLELVKKNKGRIKIRSSTKPGKRGTVISMVFPHWGE
jgi:PAS domain S-box-containing protein